MPSPIRSVRFLGILGCFASFAAFGVSGCAAELGSEEGAPGTRSVEQALGTDGNCHPGPLKASSASSTVHGDTAAQAIDGVGPGGFWNSTTTGVATLNIDMGSSRRIDGFQAVWMTPGIPYDYDVQYQDSSNNWQTLGTFTTQTGQRFDTNVNARFLRVVSRKNSGGSYGLHELFLFGDAASCGRTYRIDNVNSEKTLDVMNHSLANGGNIQQWAYGGGRNQQWTIKLIDGSSAGARYQIKSLESGKCVDIDMGSTENGANVHQWECFDGLGSQQWWIQASGSEIGLLIYNFRSQPECLDVTKFSTANGANVQQWRCASTANQRWTFRTP